MGQTAEPTIARQRYRLGRGSIRLALCLCGGLVGAAILVAVVGIHMDALAIHRPLDQTAVFLVLVALMVLAALVMLLVKRRFAGWLTITDDGLQIELGRSVRFVPWARIRTVSHGYRTLIHDDRAARVQSRQEPEDSGPITVEAVGRESAQRAIVFTSDPWTIAIAVEGQDRPVVLLAGALYDHKRAFKAVLEALEIKLSHRMG
jgi:membrane protein YdbS with pleckstrin-like domain